MTGRVIAVTGTVGKSTVKDMLALILVSQGSVITTRKSLNTRTGTSVTLARCNGELPPAIRRVQRKLGKPNTHNRTRPMPREAGSGTT
ncbi:Mur ligase family protein [Natronohydrobacter thiooxidans]|uniref:Mur ligase family protein n=1 Tax=Natronohydrobacter thiooxidans TaxID=87172 RepID=UPI000A4CCD61